MAGVPPPRQQLDELQRLRAAAAERLRLPWWYHLAGGAIVGGAFPLLVLAQHPGKPLPLLVIGMAVVLAPVWLESRRGFRPVPGWRAGWRAVARDLAGAGVAVGLALGAFLVMGGNDPVRLAGTAVVVALALAVGGWRLDRRGPPPLETRQTTPASDPLLQNPVRLRICGIVAVAVADAESRALCEILGIPDSVLTEHLELLQQGDYVTTRQREGIGRRALTWVSLSKVGRGALAAHVAELQRVSATASTTR